MLIWESHRKINQKFSLPLNNDVSHGAVWLLIILPQEHHCTTQFLCQGGAWHCSPVLRHANSQDAPQQEVHTESGEHSMLLSQPENQITWQQKWGASRIIQWLDLNQLPPKSLNLLSTPKGGFSLAQAHRMMQNKTLKLVKQPLPQTIRFCLSPFQELTRTSK